MIVELGLALAAIWAISNVLFAFTKKRRTDLMACSWLATGVAMLMSMMIDISPLVVLLASCLYGPIWLFASNASRGKCENRTSVANQK